jgi:LPS-assembly protein
MISYNAGLPSGLALGGWGGYLVRLYSGAGEDYTASTAIGMAGARGSATFERIDEPGWGGISRLRHRIEPALEYTYVETRNQTDLPFFDYDDRTPGGNLLSWSFTSVHTARMATAGAPEYRDLLKLRLSQGYQLSGERRDLLNAADAGRLFTDVRLELVAAPAPWVSVETDSRFSSYNGNVTQSSIMASVHDDQGKSHGHGLRRNEAAIGYRRIEGNLDYLEGRLALNLLNPFMFTYSGRYSFDRQDFLEETYTLEYRHQCWSITFSYRDRHNDQGFFVNFNLAGAGGADKVTTF